MAGRIEVTYENGKYIIKGNLDENANLQLIETTTHDPVILDLSGLNRINSIGIKKWFAMKNALGTKKIIYENCPVCVVEQVNLVRGLLENAEMSSFYLPFYCFDCELAQPVKITTAEAKKTGFVSELTKKSKCSQCQAPLEFDEDEETFFDFLVDVK